MNVAIVGCGRIFKKHCEVLSKFDNFNVIAVCDIVFDRMQKATKLMGCIGYSNYKDMVRDLKQDIDLLVICTYPSAHAEIAIYALENNINVLIEKPITLSFADMTDLYNKSITTTAKVFEVKQNRYNKPIEKLKESVLNGSFGKISLISVRLRWCRKDDYFTDHDEFKWRGTYKHDGGVFASQACHHVDLLRYIGGDVVSVNAVQGSNILNIEAEDTGIAIVTFRSGAIGIIEATNAARPENLEASISVLGENGTVIIGGTCVNKIDYWDLKDCPIPKDCCENPPNIYGFGHVRVYEEIHKYLNHEQNYNVVNIVDAFKTVELINAIYESIETGDTVFTGEDEYDNKLGK